MMKKIQRSEQIKKMEKDTKNKWQHACASLFSKEKNENRCNASPEPQNNSVNTISLCFLTAKQLSGQLPKNLCTHFQQRTNLKFKK